MAGRQPGDVRPAAGHMASPDPQPAKEMPSSGPPVTPTSLISTVGCASQIQVLAPSTFECDFFGNRVIVSMNGEGEAYPQSIYGWCLYREKSEPDVMAHACNASTFLEEAERELWVQGWLTGKQPPPSLRKNKNKILMG